MAPTCLNTLAGIIWFGTCHPGSLSNVYWVSIPLRALYDLELVSFFLKRFSGAVSLNTLAGIIWFGTRCNHPSDPVFTRVSIPLRALYDLEHDTYQRNLLDGWQKSQYPCGHYIIWNMATLPICGCALNASLNTLAGIIWFGTRREHHHHGCSTGSQYPCGHYMIWSDPTDEW